MTKLTLNQIAKRARESGFSRRSEAYRWLRRRHASLAKLLAQHEPPMAEIAAEMAAAGVKGGGGRPLTADALRRIWKRVCRDVEASGPKPPRQPVAPVGWKPVEARLGGVRENAKSAGDSVDAMIEEALRETAQRSGR